MALVKALDHFTILTNRLAETVDFFVDVLGLENRPEDRPAFQVQGAWLWLEDRALVHLIEIDADKGSANGSFDHVAFRTENFDALVDKLSSMGVEHSVADQPQTRLRQLFFDDPNGVKLEVTCPAEG